MLMDLQKVAEDSTQADISYLDLSLVNNPDIPL